jgi:phage tail protein X
MADSVHQPAEDMRRPKDLRRRLSALGTSFAESRGARFARRKGLIDPAKTVPTLADIVNLPDWILCEEALIDDIAAVAALLHYRHAIDHELSGVRLRAICESVGEANYDLACEAPILENGLIADVEAKLPSPDQLRAIGQSMLDRALPITMRPKFSEACGDANMRVLSNIATALVIARQTTSAENSV